MDKHYHKLLPKYFKEELSYNFYINEVENGWARLYSCLVCAAMVSDTCAHMAYHEAQHE